jgi:hypothetical protein
MVWMLDIALSKTTNGRIYRMKSEVIKQIPKYLERRTTDSGQDTSGAGGAAGRPVGPERVGGHCHWYLLHQSEWRRWITKEGFSACALLSCICEDGI